MAERIYSIDAVRILAMVFIVVIHTNPFEGVGAYGNALNFQIETTARFAVPFFFVTSGYFFARKTAGRDPTAYFVKRVRSIASLYGFGILLASPVFVAGTAVRAGVESESVAGSVSVKLTEFVSPLELVYYGTSVSEILWFLPALLFSFGFVYLFVRFDKAAYLLPVALGFHVVGLLGASYTMFVDIPFRIRDGLFFGFFYTSLGYTIAARDWHPNAARSRHYLAATVVFGALHIAERYALGYLLPGRTFADGVYAPSYTIATALVTLSLFLFLLSRPRLGADTPLPSWGNYAVGIYIAHPPVLFVLERVGETLGGIEGTILWQLTLTPATFFGALLLYLAVRERCLLADGTLPPELRRIRDS
ncbi:acyltransferase [Haloferacaceae archaeon DSL9]